MTRARRRCALLGAILALAACDEAWDLDVLVLVAPAPPSWSAAAFQVFVAFDDGGGLVAFRIGYACGGDPFSTTARLPPGAGPAPPAFVEGWLVPVAPSDVPFCGPLAAPERVSPAPVPPAARARAAVGGPVPAAGCGGVVAREATLQLASP